MTATGSRPRSPSWPTSWAAPIEVAVQEQQLGTGHAVGCGLSALPDDFAGIVVVTSGDVPLLDADTLADLIAAHRAEPAAATVLTTTLPDPTGYGRILRTQDREVIGIVEQADASPSQQAIREVNAGVYAFDMAALRSALGRLRPHNAQQELYLTDVISIVRQTARSCAPSTSTTPRWSPASTTGCSWPSWAPSSTGASSPPISARA